MNYVSIAVDGPSGAGKSTLAKLLGEKLGFLYVDTGAIYRTVGLCVQKKGVDPSDREGVSALLPHMLIELRHGSDGLQRMMLDGEDVTTAIRQHEISAYASAVSAIPEVRAFLLEQQRTFARTQNIIMDGRDIGTVVLPKADIKIFLTASLDDRAQRRYEELIARGQSTTYEKVKSDIETRDFNDANRPTAPLKQADDAILVDTTGNSLEESFRQLMKTIKEQLMT